MFNKNISEESLSRARVHFCDPSKIWCGAIYNTKDVECKNCNWPELRKKFDEGFTNE
jgi:hypothetical protein